MLNFFQCVYKRSAWSCHWLLCCTLLSASDLIARKSALCFQRLFEGVISC